MSFSLGYRSDLINIFHDITQQNLGSHTVYLAFRWLVKELCLELGNNITNWKRR